MVQFMSQRLMELDVEGRCGAGYDEKNPERLKRELAHAGDQVPIGHEAAALTLGAEAQILELHQHGDGEAVVAGRVLNVGWFHASFGEGQPTRNGGAGIREVDLRLRCP